MMMADTAHPPFLSLLKTLEALYQILFNLTVKAQEQSSDLDKQVAIEETREGIVEETSQILAEATLLLSKDSRTINTEFNIDLFKQKKEKIVSLIGQIQLLDKERASVFREEKERLRQELRHASVGKHAAIAYQNTLR